MSIRIEHIVCPTPEQMEFVIEGMRNPKNSWHLSDSYINLPNEFVLGEKDKKLMLQLRNAGAEHRKFMRQMPLFMRITAPQFWWSEFDTYKVATTRNSCSKMHKIHVVEFTQDSCSHEAITECGGSTLEVYRLVIDELNFLRDMFNKTQEKRYWRAMIELLPSGYNMTANVSLNYETALSIYNQRKNHKLFEWNANASDSICTTLSNIDYSFLITGEE